MPWKREGERIELTQTNRVGEKGANDGHCTPNRDRRRMNSLSALSMTGKGRWILGAA